jgi:hypothetical protein
VCAIAASAGALVMSGCASTAAKPPSSGGGTAAATTPAADGTKAPAGGGTVGLTDYSDNDGAKSTVILTGAVGDFGEAVSVHPDGTVDPDHRSQLNLALRDGSFRISIADLDKKFVSAMNSFPSDTSTCSGTVTVAAPAPIVAGSGTGSYRGISGEFNLTLTLAEVDAKANCGASSAFLRQSIVTAGSGTVSFG